MKNDESSSLPLPAVRSIERLRHYPLAASLPATLGLKHDCLTASPATSLLARRAPGGPTENPAPAEYFAIAMSQANVNVVEQALAAFSGGEADSFAELTTPDLEWATGLGAVEGEVFRGREGIDTYFARLSGAWDEFRFLAEDYRDLGDVVVALGRLEGRGRGGGVPVDAPVGAVWDLRDGKIWRLRAYLDHAAALAAAGLSE
jgi:ketosteroid isomerase-like protein